MGYFGFRRFRILVAERFGEEVGNHYKDIENGMMCFGNERDLFFEKYDNKTEKLIAVLS